MHDINLKMVKRGRKKDLNPSENLMIFDPLICLF